MFKEYEKAWEQYRNGLDIVSLPLISWEFYNLPRIEQKEFNAVQSLWNEKINYNTIISKMKKSIVVTDANFRIIFASSSISEMTGYDYQEIRGRSPKMFQGEKTSEETREKIRIAIKDKKPFKEVILNYRKNGETYYCEIEAHPKFDKDGNFLNYIAFEQAA
jgi:PAS domain S-box-containing protein